MKRIYYISLLVFAMLSCQLEDDNAPSPDDAFIKYYGDLTSFTAKDIEVVTEGGEPTGLVVLGTRLNPEVGQEEFYVLRTDLNGTILQSRSFGLTLVPGTTIDGLGNDTIPPLDINQDGSLDESDAIRGNAIPARIKPTENGFLVVGSTTILGTTVLTVAILDANLDLVVFFVRRADVSNAEIDLFGNDIIQLSTGGLLIVGKIGSQEGGNDFDSYILKLTNGGVEFEKPIGVEGSGEDEEAVRVFEKPNNNLVLIGQGNTNSRLGENDGENGQNVYFIELDPNGNPVNRRYYGVDNADPANTAVYNETVGNAIDVPGGYVVVGTSATSQNETYGFAISMDNDGGFLSGSSLPSTAFVQGEQGLQTRILGVTEAVDTDLVLVGQYPGFTSGGVGKSGEALFMKVDQSVVPVPGNESNFGLVDGNDEFIDAVTLPDGSIVVVGNIDFGAGTRLISIIKLNDSGSL